MSAPLVPLYGFLRGDVLGILVLVHGDDRVEKIGEVLQHAAAMRVKPQRAWTVWFGGRELPASLTITEAGLSALDRVDVIPEGG